MMLKYITLLISASRRTDIPQSLKKIINCGFSKMIFAQQEVSMAFFRYKNQNVYYQETGNGSPLLLLHGNTASSKMFDNVIDCYKNGFRLILVDFLGHGKSDRLEKFPTDLWYDEAMQVIELIEQNNYDKANLLGTSGGALVALNVALE
jgi:pimeloyl-ACP methyl ester carboxylesterase